MKKKVLIMMPSMNIGGAERSLLGLLEKFNYDKYSVYLFLFRKEGEFLKYVPEEVSILDEIPEYTTFDRPIKDVLRSSLFRFGIVRIISKLALRWYCKKNKEIADVWKSMQYTSKYITPLLPRIRGSYDLAISFLGVPFYMDKVKAEKKMAWIHTDYESLYPNFGLDRAAYSKVDCIVTVSEKCEQAFLKKYPDLKEKSLVIENILSEKLIQKQKNEFVPSFSHGINLLSIGRFCEAKNFDNIPDICSQILNRGIDVTWYIIGFGGDEQLILNKIKSLKMEKHVVILGKKENPYPYICKCDYYVQPSRYEGKCVTVREAQLLNKAVIITDYETAGSQLRDGVDGLIVPLENERCAEKIAEIIADENIQKMLVDNTRNFDYTNAEEINKIYSVIES